MNISELCMSDDLKDYCVLVQEVKNHAKKYSNSEIDSDFFVTHFSLETQIGRFKKRIIMTKPYYDRLLEVLEDKTYDVLEKKSFNFAEDPV